MNKTQSAKLDSYKLIVTESKLNSNSIAAVPSFVQSVGKLAQICAEADELRIHQEKDIKGITINKGNTLENLTDWILEISGAIYSHAHDQNDNALMTLVDYKQSQMERMSQEEIIAAAGIILGEANKISIDILANEGISADDINSFSELIAYFKSIKTSNREAVIDRSGTTDKLNQLITEASNLVKNRLDRLALQFKRKAPEFYLKYKAARGVKYRTTAKKETPVPDPEPVKTT